MPCTELICCGGVCIIPHSEVLRVIDSLQLTVEKKVATPADWMVCNTTHQFALLISCMPSVARMEGSVWYYLLCQNKMPSVYFPCTVRWTCHLARDTSESLHSPSKLLVQGNDDDYNSNIFNEYYHISKLHNYYVCKTRTPRCRLEDTIMEMICVSSNCPSASSCPSNPCPSPWPGVRRVHHKH